MRCRVASSAPTIEKRKVPKAALSFNAGAVKFAKAAGDGNAPVSVRARSGQPINHWYWGKVVHDMAGFKAIAPSVPLDYCHEDDQILGYLDKFNAGNDGLDCDGQVVPFLPEDRANEVLAKSGRGVPYQASIYFDLDSLVIEQLGPGAKAQVNGYTLEGPGVIFRQWTLLGVAVCPYGYDPNTSTRLNTGGRLAGEIELSISQLTATETDMSKQTAPETKPAETKPVTELTAETKPEVTKPVDARAEFKATLEKFSAKFGAENGSKWAADGLSYEAALEKHAEALSTQLSAEKKTVADQASKLAALPRGEKDPVSFSTNEQHEGGQPVPAKFAGLGKLANFAANLKLPGAAAK